MQIFFPNGLWRFLKNGHLPVKLHSSAPPPRRETDYIIRNSYDDAQAKEPVSAHETKFLSVEISMELVANIKAA